MANTLEALIFDVDGTLADTERNGHRVAFNRAFTEVGLNWYWDERLYGQLLAVFGGKERMRYYIEHMLGGQFAHAEGLDAFLQRLHALKTRHYHTLVATGAIRLRPGIKRLVTEARQAGLRLAIATTTSPSNVTALLERTLGPAAPEWFEVVGAGDVVATKKPAPDVYYYVLDKMNISPDTCLAFEDSEFGLLAARAAGLKTVVTVVDYTRAQNFSGAVLVLNHLGEPDQPFRVLAGSAGQQRYFDLTLARQLQQS